ncbi:MAG: hydantoinase/oxoprolinase family protein [Pirellulaceae bacterium]|nr:hydantoinase/oxoprolinase family protein [Pirellulaceae bacterium]
MLKRFTLSRDQLLIVHAPVYQAWIDVGGTFTDCYVVDDCDVSHRRRIKVLSTGLVPVSRLAVSEQRSFIAPELTLDAPGFWNGALLRCYDDQRKSLGTIPVSDFDPLSADGPKLTLAAAVDQRATGFELDAGLEAPVLAVRRLLGCALSQPLPRLRVRMGTTRGTNALLTRRGAAVALAITASLEDLLLIGDQTRPNLFDLAIRRDDQLTKLVLPIVQRHDAQGQVIQELNEQDARQALLQARQSGCESLAICLMHSYRNPEHELRLEALAREVGFDHISRSSSLAPLIEIVARARTTVVDAYLGPIVRSYLQRLAEQFGGAQHVHLQVMTSSGGLVDWSEMAGKDSILSGPAGGVVALRAMAQSTGRPYLIGLDMGGTSTDTCRTAPDQGLEYESTKAGVRILTPTLPIETVASGGGSVCWFDGVSLRVGPQSAGAMPGPACYGRGGPLTITDLNAFLGRLPAAQFPFPLDLDATAQRLRELNEQLLRANVHFASLELLADGLRAIAAQQMAEAVRTISIAQGADPRQHALVGFGGAAGQHICEIADLLGIDSILDTQEAGLLSALGMGLAAERRDAALPVYQPLDEVDFERLRDQASQRLVELAQGWELDKPVASSNQIEEEVTLELRYQGTDTALAVVWPVQSSGNQLTTAFHELHRQRFGYARPHRAIEVVSVRLQITSQATAG